MDRVVIENVYPEIDCGKTPIKRVVGGEISVRADIFCDGRDKISASLLYRKEDEDNWKETPMDPLENDRWSGKFTAREMGRYRYSVKAWIDRFATWQRDLEKKYDAGRDVEVELLIGSKHLDEAAGKAEGGDEKLLKEYSRILEKGEGIEEAVRLALSEEVTGLMEKYGENSSVTTYDKGLPVRVDRRKALFSAWYEMFPRSCSPDPDEHGTFKDCERILPKIADMGFDVLYFPPIHPIGKTNRRGRNNSPQPDSDAPGSPWSIGSEEGGHKSVHPKLGTVEEFEELVEKAESQGLEIALDLTFNCSFDHPYLEEHPEWFEHRPDGSIQFAENPPKEYKDVVPLDFETENWKELWEELKSIVLFWIDKGVKIFRVDNPHTKPFKFWKWLIREVKEEYPETIFLSEAFTRPKVMYKLAKIGFCQSYTYFTWRNTKGELTEYLKELTEDECSEYFRPNFWPNTPDILPEYLQYGGRPAFIIRFILASTLSSNYGIYGPAFELCVDESAPDKEEYEDSEKYEIKNWDRDRPGNIKNVIKRVNRIRKNNPALQSTRNLEFLETDNEKIISYLKATDDDSNIILTVVSLDPHNKRAGWIRVPRGRLNIPDEQPYLVNDLLSGDKYIWDEEWNYVELDPSRMPAHIFEVRSKLRKEKDFDYFI